MSAVRKPKVIVPSLTERVEALLSEIASLALHERIDALRPLVAALQPLLDRTLNELAEEWSPKGNLRTGATGQLEIVGAVPPATVRQAMNIRGGYDLLVAFIESTRLRDASLHSAG
jgi:hypothetical protein